MAEVLLWHFPISHYNEKARWALDWKRIPHVRKVLSVDYLPRALWATGRGTLPILFLDGKAIGDSTRIIEVLERFQPDPPLYPADPSARRRALEIEDFFDEEVGHPVRTMLLAPVFGNDPEGVIGALSVGMGGGARRAMRAIFPAFRAFYKFRHGINPASAVAASAKVTAGFDRIAAELQPSGYLVGDRFSVADLTAASLLAPAVSPPEYPYPAPGPPPQHLVDFQASLNAHPAFAWVKEMYRRHRGVSAEIQPAAQR